MLDGNEYGKIENTALGGSLGSKGVFEIGSYVEMLYENIDGKIE